MQTRNEIQVIRQRMKEHLQASAISTAEEKIETLNFLASHTITEGNLMYFDDLDYTSTNRSGWPVRTATERIYGCVLKYLSKENTQINDSLLYYIVGHLRYMSHHQFRSNNWWYNQIGLPQVFARIMILIESALPEDIINGLMQYIEQGTFKHNPLTLENVATNLLWVGEVSLMHSVLIEDEDALLTASKMVSLATVSSDTEGIQADGAFFQHGKCLYSTGYGRSFINVFIPLLYYLNNTSFSLSKEVTEKFLSHILDGVRYMNYGQSFDFLTMGREYVRANATLNKSIIPSIRILLKNEDIIRQKELLDFLEELTEGVTKQTRHKYFEIGHYLSMSNPYLFCSFKTMAEDMVTTEICNRENVLGLNFTYGTNTTFMHTGEEYINIAPCLRYDYIPGTTTICETEEELLSHPDFCYESIGRVNYHPKVWMCGGYNGDDISISYTEIEHFGVHQKSVAIATPYGMVFTGSDIFHNAHKPLHTTIEQCNALYEISESTNIVTHGQICYINHLVATPFHSSIEHRHGNFNRNSLFQKDIPIEKDILTIYIEHEVEKGVYAYEVLPEEHLVRQSQIILLNEDVHGIKLWNGREVYVFFRDCAISDTVKGKSEDIIIL